MLEKSKTTAEIRAWFAQQWELLSEKYVEEYSAGKLDRMEKMFKGLSGKEEVVFQIPMQRPYTFYLPDLPTRTFFDTREFRLAAILEENYEMIKEELEKVLTEDESKFAEYRGDGIASDKNRMTNKTGTWKVFYFWQQFLEQPENTKRCPKTFSLLQHLKNEKLLLGGMVCFSSLLPGTNIVPHTGPSNMRLTCHLGLLGCSGTKIFAGSDSASFQEGKCIIFDDSFLHEVHHQGNERRVTLMLDMWHPGMSELEIDVFKQLMQNSSSFMHPDEFFHSLKLVNPKIQ